MIPRTRLTISLALASVVAIAAVVFLQERNPLRYLVPNSLRLLLCSDDDRQRFERLRLISEVITLLKNKCSTATSQKEWQELSEDITYTLTELDKIEGGSDFIRDRRKKLVELLVDMGAAVDFELS